MLRPPSVQWKAGSPAVSDPVPQLAAPVVLVHGVSAFDRLLTPRRSTREFFPGVRDRLEAAGNRRPRWMAVAALGRYRIRLTGPLALPRQQRPQRSLAGSRSMIGWPRSITRSRSMTTA